MARPRSLWQSGTVLQFDGRERHGRHSKMRRYSALMIAVLLFLCSLQLPPITQAQVQKTEQIGTVNSQTGTSYTFVFSDRGKLVTFNNASPVAVTLPQATAAGN